MDGVGAPISEAPIGALEVSVPTTATPAGGQSGQLGGSDLRVGAWEWSLGLRQLNPELTGLLKRFGSWALVSAGLGSGSLGLVAGGGWGSYLDRGSNGIRVLNAWVLFCSGGGGAWRAEFHSPSPAPVWG